MPSGACRHATHIASGIDLATKRKLLASGVSSRYAGGASLRVEISRELLIGAGTK
jgi:hypothetical protein